MGQLNKSQWIGAEPPKLVNLLQLDAVIDEKFSHNEKQNMEKESQ